MDDQFETKAGYDAVNKYEKMRMSGSDVTCPFCGETDFDLVGLKRHLENYCDGYRDTLTVEEESRLLMTSEVHVKFEKMAGDKV